MKKKSTYFLALAILLFAGFNNVKAQEFYKFTESTVAYNNPQKIFLAPNPTPANSYFDVVIDSAKELSTARLLVYDWSGNVLKNQLIKIQPGNNVFQISIGGFEQGTYVVRLIADNNKLFSKSMQLVAQ